MIQSALKITLPSLVLLSSSLHPIIKIGLYSARYNFGINVIFIICSNSFIGANFLTQNRTSECSTNMEV